MNRKGITPVIAVVLLLLLTVGAVASAWGLYQQITSNTDQVDQLNARQAASNTEISVQTVYRWERSSGNDKINVTLRNNGGEAVNLTRDVRLLVDASNNGEYLPPDLLDSSTETAIQNTKCFGGTGEVLTTGGDGQTLSCSTGVDFPGAGDTINFRLSYQNVDGYNWDFSCNPSSSDSVRCG